MSHVHSQKIRRAFYVAGILTGLAATMKCSGN